MGLVFAFVLVGGVPRCLTADVPVEAGSFKLELNDSNLVAWRDHILPADGELNFEQISWLTTFKDGILAADADQRPLLLWTMNGHPLGCT